MTTLGDIAARAGVSISAVSRILRDDPKARAGDDTRERVRRIAAELNYRPNFAGRALRASRTYAVALVVPDLTNAVFSELMRGVEEEALARDYVVLLGRSESMQPGGGGIDRLIGEGRVDGILLQLGDAVDPADVQELIDEEVPAVLINSSHHGRIGSVALQDATAVAVAVDHLVGLGHSRIGLINGLPATDTARRRAGGFHAAMEAAGLDVRKEWMTSRGYSPIQGGVALGQILTSEAGAPTAIVVANVNAAFGALLEARSRGVAVPEDLSIVAIHDAWTAGYSWPPLTCVRMPLAEMGRTAMASLDERLSRNVVRDVVVADRPVLVHRASTAAAV